MQGTTTLNVSDSNLFFCCSCAMATVRVIQRRRQSATVGSFVPTRRRRRPAPVLRWLLCLYTVVLLPYRIRLMSSSCFGPLP